MNRRHYVPGALDVSLLPGEDGHSHVPQTEHYWLALCGHAFNQHVTLYGSFGEPTCPRCFELVYGIPPMKTEGEDTAS